MQLKNNSLLRLKNIKEVIKNKKEEGWSSMGKIRTAYEQRT